METLNTAAPADAPVAAERPPHTIDFDEPIVRGAQTISAVTLRKPKSGALRGVSLFDLMRMETEAVRTVLPRISTPSLTTADVDKMDPADLSACAQEIAGFLMSQAQRQAAYQDA